MLISGYSPAFCDPSINDPERFHEMSPHQKKVLVCWIKGYFKKSNVELQYHSSHGLKYLFKEFPVSNGQFKGGMMSAGFPPIDASEKNWRFKIFPITK